MQCVEFLLRAKLRTYASGGEGGERVLEDGTKEMTYAEENFHYRDRYFGFDPFIGEEVVWENGRAIWAMNYYGGLASRAVSGAEVYGFLQKAMRQVKADRPFRGPTRFDEGDFAYLDESAGTVENFRGTERILYRGEEVYRLDYHGGKVG